MLNTFFLYYAIEKEKRKCPPLPNGPAITNGATNHEEHHTGPELKRTGRFVLHINYSIDNFPVKLNINYFM